MSILIVTQTYHPTANGQGAFTVHLAEGLALEGYDVDVLTPSTHGRATQGWRNGVHLHEVTSLSLAPLASNVHVPFLSARQVESVFDEVHPQIVHVQDHYPLCRQATRLAQRRHFPILGTNHFLPGNMLPYIPLLSSFETGQRWLTKYLWGTVLEVYNRLDLVVTPTQSAAVILKRNGLQARLRSISNGVQLSRFENGSPIPRANLLERYGLDPDFDIFLYVGRVDRDKGLDTLIEAAKYLGDVRVQIAIAGSGNYIKRMQKEVKSLGLAGRVVFCGFVAPDDLPDLYRSVDAFVMPSLVELQSIASLEAMASGLPVLAACAGALPEIVRPGQNGYLFAPHDAHALADMMRELANHPEERQVFSRESLKMARRHDFRNTLLAYQDVYRQLNPQIELRVDVEKIEADCLGCW